MPVTLKVTQVSSADLVAKHKVGIISRLLIDGRTQVRYNQWA